MAAESATARLERLLTMVPWLMQRQGVDIEAAARTFGVSPQTLERDLQLIFVCGLPGRMPDDLIEAEWDDGHVYLRNADTIARPLRLGPDEALALVSGLRALAGAPGLAADDRDLAVTLAGRIEEATGELRALVSATVVATEDVGTGGGTDRFEQDLAARLRGAVADRQLVHLRHRAAARDEETQRDVSPMRVVVVDGHTYLEGWCHRARDVRLFRLDRIVAAEVLPTDGTPPSQADPVDLSEGVYREREDDLEVILDLAPEAEWVAEYYGAHSAPRAGATSASDAPAAGRRRVAVRAADPSWVPRLAWRTGGAVRVVSPAFLARQVERGAVDALARLGD